MSIFFHKHDLPDGLSFGSAVAIDTETMGLNLQRDRLCLVQLSAGDGDAHLVQIAADKQPCPIWSGFWLTRHAKSCFILGVLISLC